MKSAPFGTWESPITAEAIASKSIGFADLKQEGSVVYWSEVRPTEQGRYAIVKHDLETEKTETILEAPYSARTRVHEYGGSAFTVHNGTVYFVNFSDQNLYSLSQDGDINQITKDGVRFAEMTVTDQGIIAVAERHSEALKEPENFLALIDPKTGDISTLASGCDFYAAPTLSAKGQLAWVSWDHPNMPWNETHLWVADFADGKLSTPVAVKVDDSPQSYFQPRWNESGDKLVFVSDMNNWWNFYQWDVTAQKTKALYLMDAEVGTPLWGLGTSTWDFDNNDIVFRMLKNGKETLMRLDTKTSLAANIDTPFSVFSKIAVQDGQMLCVASSPSDTSRIARINTKTGDYGVLAMSSDLDFPKSYISTPEHIEFKSNTSVGKAYAYFYEPHNPKYTGIKGELPPLIVMSHGGPTSAYSDSLALTTQFWTSQGFAVALVNYGGSSGYGREFRNALDHNWGIVDVEDCVAVAKHLSKIGKVDGEKLAIRGGSAGGYTTLAALAFKDVFKAGASYYGISDLEALAKDTHKFESRYPDRLVGPYPEDKAIYEARSPIHFVDKFSAPLIVFQGEEDKIVPPNQAEMIVDALKRKDIPVEYHLYPGEQHGFRKAENIINSYKCESEFYQRTFAPKSIVTPQFEQHKNLAVSLTSLVKDSESKDAELIGNTDMKNSL